MLWDKRRRRALSALLQAAWVQFADSQRGILVHVEAEEDEIRQLIVKVLSDQAFATRQVTGALVAAGVGRA